jgi:hypothetical protein
VLRAVLPRGHHGATGNLDLGALRKGWVANPGPHLLRSLSHSKGILNHKSRAAGEATKYRDKDRNLVMRALLLASVAALLLATGTARAADPFNCDPRQERCDPSDAEDNNWEKPPSRLTVTPPLPPGPPPLGWVYGPYTQCADPPRCSMGMVNVQADGLNVRVAPNGPPVMSLVNGVPLIPLGREGEWLLVAAGCDLTPTFAWSWTAGVPLNRCWVYF